LQDITFTRKDKEPVNSKQDIESTAGISISIKGMRISANRVSLRLQQYLFKRVRFWREIIKLAGVQYLTCQSNK
jgi:hypothetical protein